MKIDIKIGIGHHLSPKQDREVDEDDTFRNVNLFNWQQSLKEAKNILFPCYSQRELERGRKRRKKKKKKTIKTSVFDEIPDQNVRINAYKTVDNSPVYNLLTYSKWTVRSSSGRGDLI